MNAHEYERWETDLVETFPEIGAWLAVQSAKTREKWRETLSDIPLTSALAATKELHAGDLVPPSGPSKYPATIRKRAKELSVDSQRRVQYYDRERAYSCQICNDSGVVMILHPSCVRQLLRGIPWAEVKSISGRTPGVTTTAICCTCAVGGQQKSRVGADRKKPELSVYDPHRHFAMDSAPSAKEFPAGLAEFLDRCPSVQAELSF